MYSPLGRHLDFFPVLGYWKWCFCEYFCTYLLEITYIISVGIYLEVTGIFMFSFSKQVYFLWTILTSSTYEIPIYPYLCQLNCVSLMANKIEQLFLRLLPICTSVFLEWLSRVLFNFFIGYSAFLSFVEIFIYTYD